MAKSRFRYNPDSLSYEKISPGFKQRFIQFLTYFAATLVIAVIYNVIFLSVFDSPKEKALRRENNEMTLQYQILNKRFDQVSFVLKDMQQRDDNIYRTIFEAEPIPNSIRKAGFGGVNRYADLEGYNNSNLVIETTKKLDIITKEVYVQSKSYDELIKLAMNKEEMLASIPAIQPISNKNLRRVASGWGYRIHPIYKVKKFHYGMDFTAPVGTEIYATGDGVIYVEKSSKRGYGNEIIIDHGFGYKTLYGHMSKFNVKQGQHVKRGEVIGYVGNTGLSTGPHLHYEVILNNKKVNPVNYYFNDLTPAEYDKMLEIASNAGQTFD
ncbi:MAG TPA: M23 family metallopeptidase [Bacteroidales bacterium]|nr:M23 family metallopeptidase [Bacteroidales bacterium]